MPPKEKGQNKGGGKKKKRKTISPLCPTSDTTQHSGVCDNKTGSDNRITHGVSDSKTSTNEVSKRLKVQKTSPEYFLYDETALEMSQNSNINYAQNPYPFQYNQSPPGQFTTMLPPTPHPQVNAQPPPWAMNMIEDLKNIKISVSSMEQTVSSINMQLTEMNMKIENIDKRVIDVETSCKFISDQYENQSKELKTAKDTMTKLEKSCSALTTKLESVSVNQDVLYDRVLDGEFRNMRNNLIFYGIQENGNGNENCEDLVKDFTKEALDLNCDSMIVDRAHRLGNAAARKPRPIIVRFNHYQDREKIRTAAAAARDLLKRNKQGVGVQIPREWREARKQLYPTMKAEKDKGKNVKFIGDKLFVNGQQFRQTTNSP